MPGHQRPKARMKSLPIAFVISAIFMQLFWSKLKPPRDSLDLVPYSKVIRISHQVTWFPQLFHKSSHSKPSTYDSARYRLFGSLDTLKTSIPGKSYTISIPENKLRISIHVFAWRRSKSLHRLLNSLLQADYSDQDFVDLHLNIDGNPSPKVLKTIREYEWIFGNQHVFIHQRLQPIGLKRMMISAWAHDDTATHTIFLEDDVSVSPLFFKYASQCTQRFLVPKNKAGQSGHHVIGCSLYTPRLDEISFTSDPQHPPEWNPSHLVGNNSKLVLYQLPCSWGAVYERLSWNSFVKYLKHRTTSYKNIEPIPFSRSNQWAQSWKRFLIEFMYAKGLVLVYPNLESQMSFSTNHYEEGVHSVPEGMEVRVPDYLREDSDPRFNVPLLSHHDTKLIQNLFLNVEDHDMPIISLHHHLVSFEALTKLGQDWAERVRAIDSGAFNILLVSTA